MEHPQVEKEDLLGEVSKLQRKIRELEIKMELVESVGLTVDLQNKCVWWHKVRFGSAIKTK